MLTFRRAGSRAVKLTSWSATGRFSTPDGKVIWIDINVFTGARHGL